MMKDDPEFNAYFVSLIQNNVCLYDYTCRDYSDRAKQDQAWDRVGKQLNETATTCKERWKNIRACYTRHLLKMKDETTKYKKPYYLADQLSFLLPFTKSRKRTGTFNLSCSQSLTTNVSQDENGGSTDYESDVYCEMEAEYEDREMSGGGEIANSPSFDSTAQLTKKAKVTFGKNKKASYISTDNSNNAEFNIFEKKHQIQINNLEEDADMNFLKSLLPDMKEMTPAQKRQYKIEILQLAQSILSEPNVVSHHSNSSSCFVHCQSQHGSTSPASEAPHSSTWNAVQN